MSYFVVFCQIKYLQMYICNNTICENIVSIECFCKTQYITDPLALKLNTLCLTFKSSQLEPHLGLSGVLVNTK